MSGPWIHTRRAFPVLLSTLIRSRFQAKPATLLIPIDFSVPFRGGGVLRYSVPKWLHPFPKFNVGSGFHCLLGFFFFSFINTIRKHSACFILHPTLPNRCRATTSHLENKRRMAFSGDQVVGGPKDLHTNRSVAQNCLRVMFSVASGLNDFCCGYDGMQANFLMSAVACRPVTPRLWSGCSALCGCCKWCLSLLVEWCEGF